MQRALDNCGAHLIRERNKCRKGTAREPIEQKIKALSLLRGVYEKDLDNIALLLTLLDKRVPEELHVYNMLAAANKQTYSLDKIKHHFYLCILFYNKGP